MALPTGLTSFSAAEHRDYHTQIAAALPWLGLPTTYTDASSDHLDHHATLQDYWKLYGVAFDPVENQRGHVAAHDRLHRFTNILSRTYGQQASYTQPAGSVSVAAGTNFNQALIDAHPAGTVFWLASGYHRPAAEVNGAMIAPKANMEFHGAPGAIVSGSVVIATGSWTSDGAGHWYATGQTQRGVDSIEFYVGPTSPADWPRAFKAESVWIDNVAQKHQAALVDVGAGEWFFDYAANRIYIGTDPAGKVVEVAMADQAFYGGGSNVKIRNLIVEKYMNAYQAPAVEGVGQTGWQVIDSTIRWTHGMGLKVNSGGLASNCQVQGHGNLGIGGGGTFTVEYCEVFDNNAMRVKSGDDAGSKFVFSTGAQIHDNWFHDNNGVGLWADINNTNPQYTWNLCERNEAIGIFHEINFGGLIADNLSRGNGLNYGNFSPAGGGILVGTSTDTEVTRNSVVDNRGGGIWGTRDPRAGTNSFAGWPLWELTNLNVHDNLIVMHSGLGGGTSNDICTGIQDYKDGLGAVSPAANNRFQNNTYMVPSPAGNFWYWTGGPRNWASWQSIPQDSTGTATSDTANLEQAAGSLVAWYDTSRETGMSRVGYPVSRLPNWHGVAGPLEQATEAARPTWQHGLNSRPSVRHNGSSHTLHTADFASVETQPNTVVLVGKFSAVAGNTFVLFDGKFGSVTDRHWVAVDFGVYKAYAGSVIAEGAGTANTSPHIIRALFNGASSSLWVDDVLVASGDTGAQSLGGITLGRFADSASAWFNGDWSEILVYAGDISASWATLRDHLEAKWGL